MEIQKLENVNKHNYVMVIANFFPLELSTDIPELDGSFKDMKFIVNEPAITKVSAEELLDPDKGIIITYMNTLQRESVRSMTLVIKSHGDENGIQMHCGHYVSVAEILHLFNFDAGERFPFPKILILEFCRGDKRFIVGRPAVNTLSESNGNNALSLHKQNHYIQYSTCEDASSHNFPILGSLFLHIVAKVLKHTHPFLDLHQMMDIVNYSMIRAYPRLAFRIKPDCTMEKEYYLIPPSISKNFLNEISQPLYFPPETSPPDLEAIHLLFKELSELYKTARCTGPVVLSSGDADVDKIAMESVGQVKKALQLQLNEAQSFLGTGSANVFLLVRLLHKREIHISLRGTQRKKAVYFFRDRTEDFFAYEYAYDGHSLSHFPVLEEGNCYLLSPSAQCKPAEGIPDDSLYGGNWVFVLRHNRDAISLEDNDNTLVISATIPTFPNYNFCALDSNIQWGAYVDIIGLLEDNPTSGPITLDTNTSMLGMCFFIRGPSIFPNRTTSVSICLTLWNEQRECVPTDFVGKIFAIRNARYMSTGFNVNQNSVITEINSAEDVPPDQRAFVDNLLSNDYSDSSVRPLC